MEAQITKPFTVYGVKISHQMICEAIDRMANIPTYFSFRKFQGCILGLPEGLPNYVQSRAADRLLQKWKKMGILHHKSRGWTLRRGGWERLQSARLSHPIDEERV